jgi:alkane 1-monooxygenase
VLPTGNAGMIVLAFVPAIWRRVLDPRVLAHFGGDISRANISPRRRAAVLERYGVPPVEDGVPPGFEERAQRASRNHPATSGGSAALAWRCPGCGYTYDVVAGEEREGFAAGTAWAEVPDSWCCPDCGVREKVDFVPVDASLAG